MEKAGFGWNNTGNIFSSPLLAARAARVDRFIDMGSATAAAAAVAAVAAAVAAAAAVAMTKEKTMNSAVNSSLLRTLETSILRLRRLGVGMELGALSTLRRVA